jgi:hypothetical protein
MFRSSTVPALVVWSLAIALGGARAAEPGPRVDPPAEVVVFESWPRCAYEKLGPVTGRSGRLGDIGFAAGQPEPEQRARPGEASGQLAAQARALGANAIILVRRETYRFNGEPGSTLGDRRDSGLRLEGIAVKIAGDPHRGDCRAGPLKHKSERGAG